MKIVFVRHGQTASNRSRALDTAKPGAPLDEEGRRQAAQMAEQWLELVSSVPDRIYVSVLERTQETAAPLAERFKLEPIVREGLREVRAGDMEMSTTNEDLMRYLDCALAWAQGRREVRMPGAENGHETYGRLLGAVDSAVEQTLVEVGEDATIAFVSHGVACRLMVHALADNVPAALVANFPMDNAATTVLTRNTVADRWHAQTWSNEPVDSFDLTGLDETPRVSGLRIPSASK